jgi:hypothetical protein
MAKKKSAPISVETLTHEDAKRTNIPTAEMQPVVRQEDQKPVAVTLPRQAAVLEAEKSARNRDLDPQLVWRGKDEQDWSDLVVQAPPIYIQEKVHPKHLIDDLVKQSQRTKADADEKQFGKQLDLFADFNGLPNAEAKTEFYKHEGHWSNRMVLGDSLQVNGVDVFDPSTGEVRSDNAGGIACWFIDTDYNGESFFVRHAYFLGQNDPYKALKTTLKAEIDPDAWASINSDTSRPFAKPLTGRIAVKVINHLGDEVMKVFKV